MDIWKVVDRLGDFLQRLLINILVKNAEKLVKF